LNRVEKSRQLINSRNAIVPGTPMFSLPLAAMRFKVRRLRTAKELACSHMIASSACN
jgi:hypothetical protein